MHCCCAGVGPGPPIVMPGAPMPAPARHGAAIEGAAMDADAPGCAVGHGAEAGCCCCCCGALGQGSVCACAAMAQLVATTSASGRGRVTPTAGGLEGCC